MLMLMLINRHCTTTYLCSLILFVTMLVSTSGYADIAVIVSKDNSIDSATAEEISALFLAKTNRLKGMPLQTIDQLHSGTVRHLFYQQICRKSAMQMKAYWSRLIFTGKGMPPRVLESAEDIIDTIVEEPDHIGYVDINEINESVKVLLILRQHSK